MYKTISVCTASMCNLKISTILLYSYFTRIFKWLIPRIYMRTVPLSYNLNKPAALQAPHHMIGDKTGRNVLRHGKNLKTSQKERVMESLMDKN